MISFIASLILMIGKGAKYRQFDDAVLLEKIRLEDNFALNILLDRYNKLVFGVCLKYLQSISDAQDLTQEICLGLSIKIEKHDIATFKSWLYRVVKNECLMILRKKKNRFSELSDVLILSEDSNENELLIDLQIELMGSKLNDLPLLQGSCIKGFYLENKSYAQLSEDLKIDMNTVKSNIQNGKRKLKLLLEVEFHKNIEQ